MSHSGRLANACLMVVMCLVVTSGCAPDSSDKKMTSESGAATTEQAEATQDASGTPQPGEAGSQPAPADPVMLSEEELAEGWISLFDGQTLFGWQSTGQADWRVEQGAIVVEQGVPGFLMTTTQFGDYQLKLDFRCERDTNSGIFLATQLEPGDVAQECYELNIAGMDNPFPTGSLVQRQAVTEDLHRDDWQSYDIRVEQGHLLIRLDDKLVLDYTDPEPIRRGHIGLQLNKGKVAFRNIRLKPLGMRSLFNGKNLEGWTEYPDMASKFTVDEAAGTLDVVNGRGQLETQQSYGDFMLQLQFKTNAAALNSGVFFRCIPGEQMNGYECQIHNGFQEGDRNQPVDCGTGGFFRRQDARRVVSDDLTWSYMTLAVDGPHMAAWVNGYQVSDWTDTREPHSNPRNGLRLEPGTIMLQGHDPTTDLSFRNLLIVELPLANDE